MKDYKFYSYEDDLREWQGDNFPDFYHAWNKALKEGRSPDFLDADTIAQLLEIYYEDMDKSGIKDSIPYILNFHPENMDLMEDILFYLNEFEEWFILYRFTAQIIPVSESSYPKAFKIAAMLHLGMEEEAFLFFKQLKKEYEKEPSELSVLYQVMGNALNEIQHHEAALQIADEAITLIGAEVEFYWIQLSSYMSMEEIEDALFIAEKIEKLAPLDKNTWFELGKAYIEMKSLDKAIDAFEFALTLGSDHIDLFMNLIGMYELNDNDLKALETAERSISVRPDYIYSYLMAIQLSLRMEMYDKALQIIEKALNEGIEQEKEELYIYKAHIFIEKEEYKKAIAVLEAGIEDTGDENKRIAKEIKELRKQYPYL